MRPLGCAFVAFVLALGCIKSGQSSQLISVSGTVTLDGKPLNYATVSFVPQGNTPGHGGTGPTDVAGKYQVNYLRGGKGLLPGSYKVTISCFLMPDGKPPPPDVPVMQTKADSVVPYQYSDINMTPLTAEVKAGGAPIDFSLKSGKKP